MCTDLLEREDLGFGLLRGRIKQSFGQIRIMVCGDQSSSISTRLIITDSVFLLPKKKKKNRIGCSWCFYISIWYRRAIIVAVNICFLNIHCRCVMALLLVLHWFMDWQHEVDWSIFNIIQITWWFLSFRLRVLISRCYVDKKNTKRFLPFGKL